MLPRRNFVELWYSQKAIYLPGIKEYLADTLPLMFVLHCLEQNYIFCRIEEEELNRIIDANKKDEEEMQKEEHATEVDEELQKQRDAEVKKLTTSLEDRMTEFRNLLLEKGVSVIVLIICVIIAVNLSS